MKKTTFARVLNREDMKKVMGGNAQSSTLCNPGCSITNRACGNFRCSCYIDDTGVTGICSTIPIG